MTKSELYRFRAIVTAKVAELERVTRHRAAPSRDLLGRAA